MFLEGHFQNAYVTRDLDRAIETFRVKYGLSDFKVYTAEMDVTTPAGHGPAANKVAFGWVGNLQFELIQPISGQVAFYTDELRADDGLRFHHICMRTRNIDMLRREVDKLKWPVVYEGVTSATSFFYVDARESLGHYLEYVQMAPETWAAMGGP